MRISTFREIDGGAAAALPDCTLCWNALHSYEDVTARRQCGEPPRYDAHCDTPDGLETLSDSERLDFVKRVAKKYCYLPPGHEGEHGFHFAGTNRTIAVYWGGEIEQLELSDLMAKRMEKRRK